MKVMATTPPASKLTREDLFMAIELSGDREENSGFMLGFMWLALLCSVGLVATGMMDWSSRFTPVLAAVACVPILWQVISPRQDEYLKGLAAIGAKWASLTLAFWMIGLMFAGQTPLVDDALTGTSLCVLAFHLGVAQARLRGSA